MFLIKSNKILPFSKWQASLKATKAGLDDTNNISARGYVHYIRLLAQKILGRTRLDIFQKNKEAKRLALVRAILVI